MPAKKLFKKLVDQSVNLALIDKSERSFMARSALNTTTLQEYVNLAKASIRLNAFDTRVTLWKNDAGRYVILDGWHRIEAAELAQLTEIHADVLVEDQHTAIVFAMGANFRHGVPLSSAERLEACFRAIEAMTARDGCSPSSACVAEALTISETAVRQYRNQLETANRLKPYAKVRGKDGKVQSAKKTKVKKQIVPEAAASTASAMEQSPSDTASADTAAPVGDASSELVPIPMIQATDELQPLRAAIKSLQELEKSDWQARSDLNELLQLVQDLNGIINRFVQPPKATAALAA